MPVGLRIIAVSREAKRPIRTEPKEIADKQSVGCILVKSKNRALLREYWSNSFGCHPDYIIGWFIHLGATWWRAIVFMRHRFSLISVACRWRRMSVTRLRGRERRPHSVVLLTKIAPRREEFSVPLQMENVRRGLGSASFQRI